MNLRKAGVLGLESLVELLGDFFYIEGFQSPGDAGQSEDFLLFQREDKAVQLLEEQLARLRRGVMIGANRRGLTRLLANPLPDLPAVRLVGEDDQVLEVILGNELVELDSNGVIGNGVGNQNNHATLLSDGMKAIVGTVDLFHEIGGEVVPAKLLDEQLTGSQMP